MGTLSPGGALAPSPFPPCGHDYRDFLAGLHARLEPRSYLEIGTQKGRSLALANCASIAVDPNLQVLSNGIGEKPSCLFVQATSDAFFKSGMLSRHFPDGVDFAFLDGLHHYEVLRAYLTRKPDATGS